MVPRAQVTAHEEYNFPKQFLDYIASQFPDSHGEVAVLVKKKLKPLNTKSDGMDALRASRLGLTEKLVSDKSTACWRILLRILKAHSAGPSLPLRFLQLRNRLLPSPAVTISGDAAAAAGNHR
jgi:hypothetical protein